MTEHTHCQICGRDIKAPSGKIAHHGYTRPGHGWQTASCFGAKWRPYEVASDALPPAILSLTKYVHAEESHLCLLLGSPPRSLPVTIRGYSYDSHSSALRPARFDPDKLDHVAYRDQRSYARAFKILRAQLESNIRHGKLDVEMLRKRLAVWRIAA